MFPRGRNIANESILKPSHCLGQIKKRFVLKLLCCQKPNVECIFVPLFFNFFFIAQFLCERSIKLLFLLYKIVVHKNEIQKCKYLGHVSFIYHVWCFLYSKLFCKCASMLEYVLEYYAWKWNRLFEFVFGNFLQKNK